MPTLTVPGAKLKYDTSGSGPQLLLIPGGPGNATSYRKIVPILSSRFTVTTYSRRGYSGSLLDGPQDYSQREHTDVDDAAALVEHLSDETAEDVLVFGTSSGAIVAQGLLTRFPNNIRLCVVHEPPMISLVPEVDEIAAKYHELYLLYREQGVDAALGMFFALGAGGRETQAMQDIMDPKRDADQRADITYWFERELMVYTFVKPDMEKLKKYKARLVCCVGETSDGPVSVGPIKQIAAAIGNELKPLSGAHVGFMTHPDTFAEQLIEILT